MPADRGVVVDLEAHHRLATFGDEGLLLLGTQVAVAVVVAGGLLGGRLGFAHGRELGFAGITAVGVAAGQQLGNRSAVEFDPLALDHGVLVPEKP